MPLFVSDGQPATPSKKTKKKKKELPEEEEQENSFYPQLEKVWKEHQKYIMGTFLDFPLKLWDTNEKRNPGRDLDKKQLARKIEQFRKMPWDRRGPGMVLILQHPPETYGLKWNPDMTAEEKKAMELQVRELLIQQNAKLSSLSGQHRLHALHFLGLLEEEVGIITIFAPIPDTPDKESILHWIGKYLQVKDESISITDFPDRMKWVWEQQHAAKSENSKGLSSSEWAKIWTQLEQQTNPNAKPTSAKTMKIVSCLIRTTKDVFDIFWKWMKWTQSADVVETLSIGIFKGVTAQMIPFLAWMIAAEDCKLPLADFRCVVKNLGKKKDVQTKVEAVVEDIFKDVESGKVQQLRETLKEKVASSK